MEADAVDEDVGLRSKRRLGGCKRACRGGGGASVRSWRPWRPEQQAWYIGELHAPSVAPTLAPGAHPPTHLV